MQRKKVIKVIWIIISAMVIGSMVLAYSFSFALI